MNLSNTPTVVSGTLFDIDHFATHDGPGIRTTIFFKGCPIRCVWCHSPESQSIKPEMMYAAARCVGCGFCAQICPVYAHTVEKGVHRVDFTNCIHCGKCEAVCSGGALHLRGETYTVEKVLQEVLPDIPFFKNSSGGVTLTGGEVLMQPEFAIALASAFREQGIHVLVETSGYGRASDICRLSEYVNTFYYDFKLWNAEKFRKYTGGDIHIVEENLHCLVRAGAMIILRVPMIHGITDTDENINELFTVALQNRIREIHLLPYNQSAPEKYSWMNRTFPITGTFSDSERVMEIQKQAPEGIEVSIV